MCRRAHGAAFVTWTGVPSVQFQITAGKEHLAAYRSSEHATRSFCNVCGSTLLFESSRWPGEVHVVVANLVDPLDRAPEAHVFYDDRVSWVELGDDLPRIGTTSGG
jgi:hypothetical protein